MALFFGYFEFQIANLSDSLVDRHYGYPYLNNYMITIALTCDDKVTFPSSELYYKRVFR